MINKVHQVSIDFHTEFKVKIRQDKKMFISKKLVLFLKSTSKQYEVNNNFSQLTNEKSDPKFILLK